jgi:hypothetical protein
MRCIPVLLLALLLAGPTPPAGAALPATHHVDLDTPGTLARLEHDKPTHFHTITQILREAPQRRPQTLAAWVRTAFDARMASALLIKTSYPPQARLEFVLDDTEYRAMIMLRSVEPVITPAERMDQ